MIFCFLALIVANWVVVVASVALIFLEAVVIYLLSARVVKYSYRQENLEGFALNTIRD